LIGFLGIKSPHKYGSAYYSYADPTKLQKPYAFRTAARSLTAVGLARTAGTVTDAVLEAAELCPVVSRIITVKLCIPTDKTPVVKVIPAPGTVAIGTVGVREAESNTSTSIIISGVKDVPSVRVVGFVQVRVAVAIAGPFLLRVTLVMWTGHGGYLERRKKYINH
jgi:hypothetical protein